MLESRVLKVLFNKSRATGKASYSTKISLPIKWLKQLGVDTENRYVTVEFDGKKIIIKKLDVFL